MLQSIQIGLTLFFAIPLIAILDYFLLSAYLEKELHKQIVEYKKSKKIIISPYSWVPACILESLFFIAGIMIGIAIK